MRARSLWLLLGLPWLIGADKYDPNWDEVQFRCEEAAAHADDCCPNLRASDIYCDLVPKAGCFDAQGCSPHPSLSLDEATEIRDASCEALRASGKCESLREHGKSGTCENGS